MNNIWNNICNVIYESQYRYIFKSLKIPIYGFATKKFDTRIRYIFKYFILVFFRLSRYKIKNNTYDMVFFLPYKTTSNVDNLLPVVKSCLDTGKNPLLILGEDFSDTEDVPSLPCCNKIYISELYGNVSICLKLTNIFNAIRYLFEIYRSFKKYPEIMISIRRNYLSLYFHIYSTLFYRDTFNNIFSKITSKCAISTGDFWPVGNQFVQTAIEHGYNTYIIQHGIISDYWWPFDAKYYFVWGELHKDQLVNFGAPEKNILVVGMPALDKNIDKISDYKNILSKRKNILILSQTHAPLLSKHFFDKYASCLRLFNENESDYIVTVKLHPNEDMRFYKNNGFSNSNRFFFIKKERPVHDLILESDLCMTFFSTGGLEAIALNRALIVLNLESWIEEMAWWPKHGGGIYISDDICLSKLLNDISINNDFIINILVKQKEFKRKSFCNIGNASNIIIGNISANLNSKG